MLDDTRTTTETAHHAAHDIMQRMCADILAGKVDYAHYTRTYFRTEVAWCCTRMPDSSPFIHKRAIAQRLQQNYLYDLLAPDLRALQMGCSGEYCMLLARELCVRLWNAEIAAQITIEPENGHAYITLPDGTSIDPLTEWNRYTRTYRR